MSETTPAGEGASPRRMSREELALLELGRTTIARPVALALVLAFLATIVAVPLVQHAHEFAAGEAPHAWRIFATAPSERAFHEYEQQLADESVVGEWLLPRVQAALVAAGAGNEQAYLGPDGWLFYRPGFDYVTGRAFLDPQVQRARRLGGNGWEAPPEPDPVPAIVDFRDQLRARGVELVLLPTSVKPMFDPTGTVDRAALPLQNPSYPAFRSALAAQGVRVFDPATALSSAPAPFLKTDTHWSPTGMQTVAAALAAELAAELPPVASPGYRAVSTPIENLGDIAVMLRLAADQTAFPRETVDVPQVVDAAGAPWQPNEGADVLVLGDSFSNIYSLQSMGWGTAAGFVEQLSLRLQRPLDRIAINDGGAVRTRRALRDELLRGRDRLAGKRLLIWQFAIRELAVGDWQRVELPAVERPAAARAPVTVRARIVARGTPPQPGSVPYKDCLVGVRVQVVATLAGAWPAGERRDAVLVYVEMMRDNALTPPSRWQVDSEVELALTPWESAPESVRSLNRRELDDDELLLADPWYGVAP